jgi:hypothetical protein
MSQRSICGYLRIPDQPLTKKCMRNDAQLAIRDGKVVPLAGPCHWVYRIRPRSAQGADVFSKGPRSLSSIVYRQP